MADDDKAFLLQSLLQYVLSFVFVYRALRRNFTCTLFTKLFKRHCIPTSMSLLYMCTFFRKTYCLLSPLLWPHLSKQDLSLICLSILGNFCQNKFYFWNKRHKFLKKLSCCIGGVGNTLDNLILSTELVCKLATLKSFYGLSITPSSEGTNKG